MISSSSLGVATVGAATLGVGTSFGLVLMTFSRCVLRGVELKSWCQGDSFMSLMTSLCYSLFARWRELLEADEAVKAWEEESPTQFSRCVLRGVELGSWCQGNSFMSLMTYS
jgi:hypothetical protein